MFAFGIGSSVNRHLIEGMANVGMGKPFVVTHPDEAKEKAEKFRKLIQSPVLTNIKIDYGKFYVYDVEPPSIPDVLAERPVIIFGKWRGKPIGKIKLTGITGNEKYRKTIDVSDVKPAKNNSALRYLWARHKISVLADYNRLRPNDERINEVTNLGLTYNLLTAYTSFIAIDSEKRLENGQATTVKQPLPLPQGVSDYAVGNVASKMMATQLSEPSVATEVYRVEKGGDEDKKDSMKIEESRELEDGKKVSLEIYKIEVPKGLIEKDIRTIIENNMAVFESCVHQAGGKWKTIKVIMTVNPSGSVITFKIKGVSGKKETEKCLLQNTSKIKFPSRSGKDDIEIVVIFNEKK
ncbi:MAG: hypothetical protein K9L30_00150 [Desulfobacterales bacterium]|nr:hypothetical protein [Desulfobacterales bacterium]